MSFSVVITTKNRIPFLKRTLESVLSSSVLPQDIIVINDGGEFIKNEDFSTGLCQLSIINNKISKGANYSRNLGVDIAASEIVFLLDDDDAVTKTSFYDRLELFKESPDVGIVFTGLHIVRSSNLSCIIRTVLPYDSSNYHHALLSKGNVIGSTSRVAIRKSFFYEAGSFDIDLQCMQDYDLWVRMCKVCKVRHDGRANIIYTVHDNGEQISSKYRSYLQSGFYLKKKYLGSLESYNIEKAFESHIYFRVALSSASTSFIRKCYFSFQSFIRDPSFKKLALFFLPFSILKRLRAFA